VTTPAHDARLDAVIAELRACGAASVLDLGCGDGPLLERLAAEPGIARVVGIDIDAAALERARARLDGLPGGDRIALRLGSMTTPDPALTGFDAAALVETIEHVDPGRLSALASAILGAMRPLTVVMTTPNAEFNALLGVPPHRFRHPGHRFEWSRAKFQAWAGREAARAGYAVRFADAPRLHPDLGGPTQMAVFSRAGP